MSSNNEEDNVSNSASEITENLPNINSEATRDQEWEKEANNLEEKEKEEKEKKKKKKKEKENKETGAPRATQPGAVAVPAEEAARLDQRIAEKRGDASVTTNTPAQLSRLEQDIAAKHSAKPTPTAFTSMPGAFSEAPNANTAGRTELSMLESDVAAKQRARPTVSNTTPGAVFESTSPGHTELTSLESDVAAKQRARPTVSNATPGAVFESTSSGRTELASLESDVAAKQRTRPTFSNVTPGAVFESTSSGRTELASLESDVAAKQRAQPDPSGRTELASLESDVAAKQRAAGSGGRSTTPGAHAELTSLEDSITAKIRGQAGTAVPGGHSELSALEDSVTAKVRGEASRGAHAELTAMEDAVAAKSRGSEAVKPGAHSELSALEDSVLSKQNDKTDPRHSEISRLDERIAAKTTITAAAWGYETRSDKGVLPGSTDLRPNGDAKAKLGDLHLELALEQARDKGEMEMSFGGPGGGGSDQGLMHAPDVEYGLTGQLANGLAVAFAVTEEEDDAFIPAAVEYDPDAKPPIYKNRRFRLYSFLAFIVLLMVAIGAAVGLTVSSDDGYSSPTSAPTHIREGLGIREQIERLVGSAVLEDEDSPYVKALNWLIFDDPQQITVDADNFVQRYTAAYLYYATSMEKPWYSCNPPEGDETKDCFFQRLTSITPLAYEPVPWVRWLSEAHECKWAGTYCDDSDQIRALEIVGQQMNGKFPEGIVHFPFLQSLALPYNEIRGALPSDLGEMKHLVTFELHFNKLTGTIPPGMWQARNIQRLNLGENAISGSIPSDIGNLSDMKGLFIFGTELNGSLPEEIGQLSSLAYLRMQRNKLTGSIPSSIGNMANLQELFLHTNQLIGKIPEIGALTKLQNLRIGTNKLTGDIPESMYSLPVLANIELFQNKFSGTISPKIGEMPDLYFFRVDHNELTGQIPSEMALLDDLRMALLDANGFTGTMPAEVCALAGSTALKLLTSDCKADDNAFVEFTCPCCTGCCNPDGEDCEEV